jgi:para-nitrobenzyl esterase
MGRIGGWSLNGRAAKLREETMNLRISKAAVCWLFLWCTPMYAAEMKANHTTEITVRQGALLGSVQNDVTAFYNVPYAKNPFIDERRFQAPEAYGAWDGQRDATLLGQPVPQPSRGKTVELVGAPGDLTLNIWRPTERAEPGKKWPVMVWIPGGAFIREDAGEPVYDGSSFARNGVIVVTINYRVGVDGFMHLNGAPDNRGILDQIMALQWVQQNISDFDGDPHQVTLFGQSAGAESVAILLGTDKAKGLFQKAILQSPPMQYFTESEALRIADHFAAKLNVPATVEGMSSVPLTKLVAGVIDMGKTIQNRDDWGMISWGGTAFLPVRDGVIIEDSPMKDLAKKTDPSIPVIVGSTDQEARLYLVPNGAVDHISAGEKALLLEDLSLSGDPSQVYSAAEASQSIGESFIDIQSDYTFRMPALHIAEQLVNHGHSVWHYNFSWFSPAFGGKLGAAHFVDVPFAFNTIYSDEAKGFVGSQPPQALAEAMHTEWLNFAKSGVASWTPYNLHDRPTMRFDTRSQQLNDPEKRVRKLWQHYLY